MRQLSDAERLSIAVDLLDEQGLKGYAAECEAKESESKIETLIRQLESEGWQQQDSGICHIQGMSGINLLHYSGEMLGIQLTTCPDEETVELLFPNGYGGVI